jgi:hypothetical protein
LILGILYKLILCNYQICQVLCMDLFTRILENFSLYFLEVPTIYYVFLNLEQFLGFKPKYNLLEIESTNGTVQHLGPHGASCTRSGMHHTGSGPWPSCWPDREISPAVPFGLCSPVSGWTECSGVRPVCGGVLPGARLLVVYAAAVWLRGMRGQWWAQKRRPHAPSLTGGGRRWVVADEWLQRCSKGLLRSSVKKGKPGSWQGGAPRNGNKWTNGGKSAACSHGGSIHRRRGKV